MLEVGLGNIVATVGEAGVGNGNLAGFPLWGSEPHFYSGLGFLKLWETSDLGREFLDSGILIEISDLLDNHFAANLIAWTVN